jgi:hypothetical protein
MRGQGSRRREFDRITWIPCPPARTARKRAGQMRSQGSCRPIGFRGFLARQPAPSEDVRVLCVVKVPVAMREITSDVPWIVYEISSSKRVAYQRHNPPQ